MKSNWFLKVVSIFAFTFVSLFCFGYLAGIQQKGSVLHETARQNVSIDRDMQSSEWNKDSPPHDRVFLVYSCGGRAFLRWDVDSKTYEVLRGSDVGYADYARFEHIHPYSVTTEEVMTLGSRGVGLFTLKEVFSEVVSTDKEHSESSRYVAYAAAAAAALSGYLVGRSVAEHKFRNCDSDAALDYLKSRDAWKELERDTLEKIAGDAIKLVSAHATFKHDRGRDLDPLPTPNSGLGTELLHELIIERERIPDPLSVLREEWENARKQDMQLKSTDFTTVLDIRRDAERQQMIH